MRLDVRKVVLTWISECWASQSHCAVLVCRVQLCGFTSIWHQLIDVWNLQLLEHSTHNSTLVKNLWELRRQLHDRLHLGDTLGLAEDVGVRDGNHVAVATEVLTLNRQLGNDVTLALLVQVPAVDASQDVQDTALGVVQARVDGGEHYRALLNQRLSRTHRHIAVGVCNLFFGGGYHAFGFGRQPTQQLVQHWRRWVEGHGHRNLTDVVHADATLNLGHLSDFNLVGLP